MPAGLIVPVLLLTGGALAILAGSSGSSSSAGRSGGAPPAGGKPGGEGDSGSGGGGKKEDILDLGGGKSAKPCGKLDANGTCIHTLGMDAQGGIASNPAYQHTYNVQAGDSPARIAEAVFGNSAPVSRWVELIKENPQQGSVGDVNNPFSTKYNFAHLNEGDVLLLPRTWNGWIDQIGTFRHGMTPWPMA